MRLDQEKSAELERLLSEFSSFIYANILKFNIQKRGIDPDDVFQEVRIKIWRLLNNEKKINNYALYIKKIVDSSVIDFIRKTQRDAGIIAKEKQKRISELNTYYPDSIDRGKKMGHLLDHALHGLIENRRKAVKLFLSNLSLEEIAAICNWSTDKTRNLLYRGLGDLKNRLLEMGIEYED